MQGQGAVPHGFCVHDRKLLIDAKEAEEVRTIFRRYLALQSVPALVDDLAATGFCTRKRVLTSGRSIGHVCFGRGALALLLENPIYIGKIRHKTAVYDGDHEALIDPDTFNRVQQLLADNHHG